MPLFDLGSSPVKKIKIKKVENEGEIHQIIANNLETILGVRFLASEYRFPEGRIDTLGIDENNSPVIVEYKKSKSSDVILQALFYKSWLMEHQAAFELLCGKKLKEEVDIEVGDLLSTEPIIRRDDETDESEEEKFIEDMKKCEEKEIYSKVGLYGIGKP